MASEISFENDRTHGGGAESLSCVRPLREVRRGAILGKKTELVNKLQGDLF